MFTTPVMKGVDAGSPSSSRPGDRVAVRRLGGVIENLEELALDLLAHHMLPAACFLVHELPLESDHVGEQTLGQAVLAHDVHGLQASGIRQLEVAVTGDDDEAVALHAGDRLRDRRPGVPETLGDASSKGNDVLLLEIEDGAEIHLRRVDEVRHSRLPCRLGTYPVSLPVRRASLAVTRLGAPSRIYACPS